MEFLVLAALGLAAILIKAFAYRAPSDVIDKRDTYVPPQRRPTHPPRPARTPPPASPKSSRPNVPAPRSKWTDCTPSPAGARHEMSPRARRAHALAERARREGGLTLKGRAYVIDGDTIVLQKTHIRLAGIDAPEVDHPYGKASMWALRHLCAKKTIIAEIKPEISYDRAVAVCRLEDGTDLAEVLVRKGLALDWPSFSGGRYARFEPDGIRTKLWMTAKRQAGASRRRPAPKAP